jgi:N-methylhydantoinase A
MKLKKFIKIWKRRVLQAIGASQIRPEEIVFERAADMRYFGQEHAVTVDLPQENFDRKDRNSIQSPL